jgi:hypothetical protein
MRDGQAPMRRVLILKGGYYLATGVLPFVSRRLFEAITGPKKEWWLVQTVGAAVAAVGAGELSAAVRDPTNPEVLGIGAGCAAGLAAIDVVYAVRGRISPVYLADAAIQLAALAALAAASAPARRAMGATGA